MRGAQHLVVPSYTCTTPYGFGAAQCPIARFEPGKAFEVPASAQGGIQPSFFPFRPGPRSRPPWGTSLPCICFLSAARRTGS